jgi:prepilin-type N-terminal cleavage/methylation domain-containing protein
MKIKLSQEQGFTMVEIMIVVAIIGLLAAIAVPNYVNARERSQTNTCINNLRQIDAAIQEYALEKNAAPSSTVDGDDIAPYLPRGLNAGGAADIEDRVYCPVDINKGFSSSYASGLTTVDTQPTCMIGAGFNPAHVLR